ncbi:MAG TPA: NAD(P)H-dependent oxidoreductase subunit E [Syntrophales bacterium]|jgi:NADH-quinone oxidoreductase subunit E|nr:NAD(P)H-dependent oxidoreductase subunit E [Syntrophales bacterium]HOX94069.1 NAD(P)H-dependent oxidoreductase subunit E [Syntrophales bacterium]HPI58546.1 NAD(P)H-dependent oxidoreductase subunit E [Syntrophales bacterium]HQM28657.1 NAD(P)H-dependent oxidoreductase subunit E [Syntrophales bacterium]
MTSEAIEKIIEDHAGEEGLLISILEDIQDRCRYLPEEALRTVALKTGRSLADVYGVATFYKAFSLKPQGRHVISACLGTACHVRSAPDIVDEFSRQLGLKPGETSENGEFTFETVNCLGTCALGPIVAVDGRYFSKVARKDVKKIIDAAKANFIEDSPSEGQGEFPADVVCPHCGVSLMAAGKEALLLEASLDGKRAQMRISGLLGPVRRHSERDVPPDARVSCACPSCKTPIDGKAICPECGAPMATFGVDGGGSLLVCSRWGCANSMLRLSGPGVPALVRR